MRSIWVWLCAVAAVSITTASLAVGDAAPSGAQTAPAPPPAGEGQRGTGPGLDNQVAQGADFSPKPPVARLSPAEQQKHFLLPPGYKIKTTDKSFAADYRGLTKDPDPDVVIQAMLTLNLHKVADDGAVHVRRARNRRARCGCRSWSSCGGPRHGDTAPAPRRWRSWWTRRRWRSRRSSGGRSGR